MPARIKELWYCGTRIMLTSIWRERRVRAMKRLPRMDANLGHAGLPHQQAVGMQLKRSLRVCRALPFARHSVAPMAGDTRWCS